MTEPTETTYISLVEALEMCDRWLLWATSLDAEIMAKAIQANLKRLETITLPPAPAKAEKKQP